jgi:hypothetical protein
LCVLRGVFYTPDDVFDHDERANLKQFLTHVATVAPRAWSRHEHREELRLREPEAAEHRRAATAAGNEANDLDKELHSKDRADR